MEEVVDDEGGLDVDHVPMDSNLVAAVGALDFALDERYAVLKLDLTSEAHADRRQAVNRNWLALCNMAMETAVLAAYEPCLALPHMQEYTPSTSSIRPAASSRTIRPTYSLN